MLLKVLSATFSMLVAITQECSFCIYNYLFCEINVDAIQVNVLATSLIETNCRGFIHLDEAERGGGWRVEGRGLGLLEGIDPEPLLTPLVTVKITLLFS